MARARSIDARSALATARVQVIAPAQPRVQVIAPARLVAGAAYVRGMERI